MSWIHGLRRLIVLVGCLGAVWGVAYDVNGMTQAHAYVKAPVGLVDAEYPSGWGDVHVEAAGVTVPGGWLAGARPGGWAMTASGVGLVTGTDGELTIVAWGSTRLEQALARGDWLVNGLALLVGALALAPVLGSVAEGRPFRPGNTRRLVVLAVTVAVAGTVAPMLPAAAGLLVLDRTGLSGPQFASSVSLPFGPLLVGALILAVAAAFRAGERMADDLSGLV